MCGREARGREREGREACAPGGSCTTAGTSAVLDAWLVSGSCTTTVLSNPHNCKDARRSLLTARSPVQMVPELVTEERMTTFPPSKLYRFKSPSTMYGSSFFHTSPWHWAPPKVSFLVDLRVRNSVPLFLPVSLITSEAEFTHLQLAHVPCSHEPPAHSLGHFSVACFCSSRPFAGDVKHMKG